MLTRVFSVSLAAILLLAVWAESATGVEETHYYYYFKERRPLTLDVEHTAVLQRGQAEGNPQAFGEQYGIDAQSVEDWPSPGWFIAPQPGSFFPAGVRNLVQQLAYDHAYRREPTTMRLAVLGAAAGDRVGSQRRWSPWREECLAADWS